MYNFIYRRIQNQIPMCSAAFCAADVHGQDIGAETGPGFAPRGAVLTGATGCNVRRPCCAAVAALPMACSTQSAPGKKQQLQGSAAPKPVATTTNAGGFPKTFSHPPPLCCIFCPELLHATPHWCIPMPATHRTQVGRARCLACKHPRCLARPALSCLLSALPRTVSARYRPPPAPGAARYATAVRRGTLEPHLMRRHQIRQCALLYGTLFFPVTGAVFPLPPSWLLPASSARRPFPLLKYDSHSHHLLLFLSCFPSPPKSIIVNTIPSVGLPLLYFPRGIHFARESHSTQTKQTHSSPRPAPNGFSTYAHKHTRCHQKPSSPTLGAPVSVVVSFRRDLKTWL